MTQANTDVAVRDQRQSVDVRTPERGSAEARRADTRSVAVPAVDIIEDATGITLLADLPGVSKDRLTVRVEADRLFIEGEAVAPVTDGFRPFHVEVSDSVYRRSFALGRDLDRANIQANLKDGVLELRIPRLQEAQPRRIEVQSA